MRVSIEIVLTTILIIAGSSVCGDERQGDMLPDGTPVKSVAGALQIAQQYTGFQEARLVKSGDSALVAVQVCEDDKLPFLAGPFASRSLWVVSYETELQNVHVYIDSASGILYKVEANLKQPSDDIAPEPDWLKATHELSNEGEAWLKLGDEPPSVTFSQALGAPIASCAPEYTATCVVWKYLEFEERLVWVIQCRGVAPWDPPSGSRSLPAYIENRARVLIDAQSGELVMIDNSPSVEIRPEDKGKF